MAGGHNGGTFWDPLTWNSARMDTVERNIFLVTVRSLARSARSRFWRVHDHVPRLDPKYSTLGYNKFWCFVVDTGLTATQTNIKCDGTIPAADHGPRDAYRLGWHQQLTREFSKIIPDGLLTPVRTCSTSSASRRRWASATATLAPDTNIVDPQNSEARAMVTVGSSSASPGPLEGLHGGRYGLHARG